VKEEVTDLQITSKITSEGVLVYQIEEDLDHQLQDKTLQELVSGGERMEIKVLFLVLQVEEEADLEDHHEEEEEDHHKEEEEDHHEEEEEDHRVEEEVDFEDHLKVEAKEKAGGKIGIMVNKELKTMEDNGIISMNEEEEQAEEEIVIGEEMEVKASQNIQEKFMEK
jgi:TfoX/Sxy family transcriptional regulator of competence genes